MKVVFEVKVNVLAEELMKYCSVNLFDKKKNNIKIEFIVLVNK